MKTLERQEGSSRKRMGYFVRPMRLEDIAQVEQVERECFPTGWSPTPFRRELQSRTAAYLVACTAPDPSRAQDEAFAYGARPPEPLRPLTARLLGAVRALVAPPAQPPPDFSQHIAGYVGLWFVVDEGHITAIGSRESQRRQGIGELLLIASIELGLTRMSQAVTLETRVSNYPAQALYLKYGFRRAGVRKGYYSDNGEDALIMTADAISSPSYRDRLRRLSAEHADRWGDSVRNLGMGLGYG